MVFTLQNLSFHYSIYIQYFLDTLVNRLLMNGELHFNIQLLPSCGVNIESCQPEGDCFTKGFSAMETNLSRLTT